MLTTAIYILIIAGAALMVYNIIGFIRFSRSIKKQKTWDSGYAILYFPIVLLVMFLAGYIFVGVFGQPDIVMAGILFFGSVFVFIMYRMLIKVTGKIQETEKREAHIRVSEESSRVKASFLASISHELRTPMNVIMGLDSLALKNPDLQPETRDYLEKIGLSANHLLDLINNILDMNNLMSGSLEVKNEEFSLSDLLDQINSIVQVLCSEKNLEFHFASDENAGGYYIGDEMLLRQALLSILENAVKYTDEGSVDFSVECVPGDGATSTVLFTVKDTGIGIDKDFLPKMFESFSREDDSATNRYGGTGLSLAVTKKVIGLMNGEITVESVKGEGSTFVISIPMAHTSCQSSGGVNQADEVSLEGCRVLIVEDIPENAEIVQDLLELEGVETEHAENGQIALDMLGRSEPGYYDAVLMDLRMPVMDGLEATRRIRNMDRTDLKEIPILALTANAFESDVKASLEVGMNEHMAKPTDADSLYSSLKKYIGKK